MPIDVQRLIGGLGSLGGGGFAKRWQQLQQEDEQRKLREQQQQIQQKQLGFQEATHHRAEADQRMQAVNTIRQLLEDESLDTPEAFNQRLSFATRLAPQLQIEPGFIQKTFTPPPTVFQKRAAKKKLAELTKAYNAQQLQQMETGATFEVGGQRMTLAQLREQAGVGAQAAPGQPFSFQQASGGFEGNTPEKLHIAAFARERGKTPEQLSSAELQEATKGFRQSDDRGSDPVLAQIRALTLANLQRNQGSMTPAQFSMAQQLANDYTQQSKDYLTRVSAFDSIKAAARDPSAAGDLALIFSYMRMLDPGSTVREGEFANAQNAAGIPDQIRNMYNRAVSGERLNPNQRADFLKQAKAQFKQAQVRQRGIINVFTTRSRRANLNPEDVVIDYDSVFGVTDDLPTGDVVPAGGVGRTNPFRKPQ